MNDDPAEVFDASNQRAQQALYNHRARVLEVDERLTALTKAVTACAEAAMFYNAGRHGGMAFGYAGVSDSLESALKQMRHELARMTVDRSLMGKG